MSLNTRRMLNSVKVIASSFFPGRPTTPTLPPVLRIGPSASTQQRSSLTQRETLLRGQDPSCDLRALEVFRVLCLLRQPCRVRTVVACLLCWHRSLDRGEPVAWNVRLAKTHVHIGCCQYRGLLCRECVRDGPRLQRPQWQLRKRQHE